MHENRETSETPAVQPDSRAAGEGLGRTARTDVPEESHSGILPMNHSNKDRTPSAESAEGRPLIKENVRQPNTYPTQSIIWPGQPFVEKLCLLQKVAYDFRFLAIRQRAPSG